MSRAGEKDPVKQDEETDRTQGWKAQSARTWGFVKVSRQSGVPDSFALVSILPHTLLDNETPCLKCESNELVILIAQHHLSSPIHDSPDLLHNIEVDFVAIISQSGLAPWDRRGEWTSAGASVEPGADVRACYGEQLRQEGRGKNNVSEGVWRCSERVATRIKCFL